MEQNLRSNKIVSRLAAEKKKTVCALCLIALMAFMWVRVLFKKGPESVEATPTAKKLDSEFKVSFVELPEVEGRNDVLTRDFFAANGWQNFIRDGEGENLAGIKEVSVVSRGTKEDKEK